MAAGMNIFTLMGSIMIDNDKANESISKTEKKAEGLGSKLGKGIKTAGKWGLAIGAGAAAAGGALGAMANKAADSTDRIDKMSQKLGLSRESFQEWDYVMSQNGVSIDSMGSGMKTLTNQFDDLGKGSKIATEAFGELGLSYEDMEGKSQEEIFDMTIKGLQGMEDETKRAAIANDLLGRSGQELAPLLNAGAGSVEDLKKKAHELGIVLDDDAIDAGVKFQDTMDDLKRSFGAAATSIGVSVMPMIQKFADWVLANMPEIQAFMKKAFEVIGNAVMFVWDVFESYLLPVFKTVYSWVEENWPTISAIIEAAFETIKFVWNNVLSPVLGFLWDALAAVVDFVSENFPGFQKTVENVMDGVKKAVGFVVDIFKGLADGIEWALDKWNEWRNRPEDKQAGGGFSGGASDYARKPTPLAKGMDYVPYDNFPALLHKGERVLTADEARGQTINHTGTIRVEGVNTQGELVAVTELIGRQIAQDNRRLPNRASVIPI